MARPYRLQVENCLYHITSRGNEKREIFSGDGDYKKFLDYIFKAKERYHFHIYAYVLMPNHYHLLIESTQPNLSRIMQYINTSYTVYYNLKYKHSGHLFQGRYKSIVVDKDNYLLELTRYIHLNPVRAKLVKGPEEYKWSSYKVYINMAKNEIIDKERIDGYLNMDAERYSRFVLEGMNSKENCFEEIYGGFILGNSEFIKEKITDLRKQTKKGDFSYKRALDRNTGIDELVKVVADYYGRDQQELFFAKKKRNLWKKIAVYLSRRLTGLTNNEIGKKFNISYSAVSKITSDIEELMSKNKKVKGDINTIISHFKV